MRLTCPNCGARYEVSASMIPPEGRDVQCSNCSTTWFQPGRPSAPSEEPAAPEAEAPPADDLSTPPPPPPVEPEAERTEEVQPEEPVEDTPPPPPPVDEPEAPEEPDAPEEPVVPHRVTPARREIDPGVANILREEAARETRLREGEADPVETQEEMPLGAEPDTLGSHNDRADLDAAEDAFDLDDDSSASAAARRDLFPDVEEINSTLRDTGDRSHQEADATDIETVDRVPRRRQGVRIGFLLIFALAAALVALYTNADRVSSTVPALAGTVESFSSTVDGIRFWLDDLARSLGRTTGEG